MELNSWANSWGRDCFPNKALFGLCPSQNIWTILCLTMLAHLGFELDLLSSTHSLLMLKGQQTSATPLCWILSHHKNGNLHNHLAWWRTALLSSSVGSLFALRDENALKFVVSSHSHWIEEQNEHERELWPLLGLTLLLASVIATCLAIAYKETSCDNPRVCCMQH